MFHLKKRILYIVLLLLITGCGENSDATIEYHPIKERIPYWNSDIQTQTVKKEAKDSTRNLISDQDFTFSSDVKEVFNISTPQSANLPLTSEENILFRSIDIDRIVIFDVFKQSLYEYQISADSWNLIAESGPGPGELTNVQDIIIRNDTLYTVSQSSMIDLFDCQQKLCSYISTINLAENIQPVSLDLTKDGFITLGSQAAAREGATTEVESKSLFEFNQTGELKSSGGRLYDSNGHWMLLQPFGRGTIRSIISPEEWIQFFEFFPLIYHFDDNYNLLSKISISDFTLARQKYQPDTGELWIPQEDYSRIENVAFIDQEHFLLSIVHQRDFKIVDQSFDWTKVKDVYLINMSTNDSRFLGTIEDLTDTDIHFTNDHIIIRKGDIYKIATYKFLNI